ncbi:hypothetical protein WG947_00075 [Pontibacter sp. H259]|uniref:hypothetical protein n=1 Tax=Pontibacter sp. H259 TaxID=3133421 RepID=UPI0030BC0C6E
MKNKIRKASLAIVLCVGYAYLNSAQAQNNGWGEGAKLEDAEVVVEKNRVIELPSAARNFEKFKVEPPAVVDRAVKYRFEDYRLPEQDIELQMRVLTIKQDELTKLYGNYLKAGLGNYGTLYLKGFFHNKRSENSSFGANVSHVSSARGPEVKSQAAVSNTNLALHAEKYLPGFSIGGRLGYERDKNHFYGYAPSLQTEVDEDTTKQVFNRVHANGYIHNQTSGAKLIYKTGVKLNYLKDHFNLSEVNAAINLNSEYSIDTLSGFRVNGDLSFVSHKDSSTVSRTFFKLNPSYERQFGVARVTLGANIAYTGDEVNDARQFNIYPQFRLGLEPIEDNLLLYLGLGGDLQRVTLYELTKENPWIAPKVDVADINKGLEVYGGFSANLSNYVHLTGRVAYQNYRNLYFYNNSRADSTKFDLVYDDGVTNVFNIYSEAVFDYIDEIRLGLKLDYNKYNTASLDHAFHRPELMASAFATYNFYDKILFNSELYYIGSSFGRVYRPDGSFVTQETDNIIDLNLKADYKFTNTFTVFLMANNILGNKYERFVNYPVKSINVIGGVTYSF